MWELWVFLSKLVWGFQPCEDLAGFVSLVARKILHLLVRDPTYKVDLWTEPLSEHTTNGSTSLVVTMLSSEVRLLYQVSCLLIISRSGSYLTSVLFDLFRFEFQPLDLKLHIEFTFISIIVYCLWSDLSNVLYSFIDPYFCLSYSDLFTVKLVEFLFIRSEFCFWSSDLIFTKFIAVSL